MGTLEAATKNLRKHFWPLLWVQLPAASINPLQDLTEAWTEAHPVWARCSLSLSISYFLHQLRRHLLHFGKATGLKTALRAAFARWRVLLLGSVATGIIILLGFAAVLLPGIYFAAIYLFVPYLIMEDGDLPLSVYMHRSKQLANQQLLKSCGIVVGVVVLMTWSYLFGAALGKLLFPSSLGMLVRGPGMIAIHLVLAIVIGAVIDVFVCHYYFNLRGKANE
ncbi:MAG: hypothetical protein R3B54_12380 [Bdellovibrionota bacterium]